MKGGSWTDSPQRDGAAHLFWVAGLLFFLLSMPAASAWSFPFSLPFISAPDGGCQISLDLEKTEVEYLSPLNYTIRIKNSGREPLSGISISDNFGQVGFIARLPEGGALDLARTTPALTSSAEIRVVASSDGEELGRAAAPVEVAPPPGEAAAGEARSRRTAKDDGVTLRTMSSSPAMELVVGAYPPSVRPGERATVRMTVTNRGPHPLRGVEISGPGWTVEVGDLNPGESKVFTREVAVADEASMEIVAAGTNDGGEAASARQSLKVSTVSPALTVTVVSIPDSSGGAGRTEYRLKNGGEELLTRITLKDARGATLGILPRLAPGETKNLTQPGSRSGEGPIPVEVSAVSPEGKTVIGEVHVQSAAVPTPTAAAGSSRSGSKPTGRMEFGTLPELGTGLKPAGDLSVFGGPAGGAPSIGSGFGDFNINFGIFDGSVPAPADGGARLDPRGKEEAVAADEKGAEASPDIAVTLQANKTLVHRGERIAFRCAAVNRGQVPLTDVELRCGGEVASAELLAPGDGLPLEGSIIAEGPLNLTAAAAAIAPDGSRASGEATLAIGAVSPALRVEMSQEPGRISRGERVSIAVRLENGGDDLLTEISAYDDLGEIGRVPTLRPGEVVTLMRNSTVEEELEDEVRVVAIDSTGREVRWSQVLSLKLSEPGLSLEVEPKDAAAYPGEAVEVVWTIRNTGEVDLVDVTMVIDGNSSFRLPAIAAGGSTQVSSSHQPAGSRGVLARAEGRTAGGETISSEASFLMRVVSPGLSLNVKPSEVEASLKKPFNLTFLVTNTGDDPLQEVTISERSLGTLERIGRLEPGDFRVASHDFFTDTNTTFRLEATGIDSRGNGVNESREVAVKLVSANIELSIRPEPAEAAQGGSVHVTFSVENRGEVPIFSTFIMGRTLGHLGTIDYISPGSLRSLERDLEVTGEMEEEITAEGFTRDGSSVRDSELLSVGLKVETPIKEATPEASGPGPGRGTTARIQEAAPGEEVLPDDGNYTFPPAPAGKEEGAGIAGLLERLKGILEKIRLMKDDPVGMEGYDPGALPAGSGEGASSAAPRSGSLPGAPTTWSGYGTHQVGADPEPQTARPGGAGYAYSGLGGAAGDLSRLGPRPETSGYASSAEGPASKYLTGPGTAPEATVGTYSASGPAPSYLSSPWTSAGDPGYTPSKSGPLSPITAAGGSPTIAGSGAPIRYESSDLRSASEASPAVGDSRGSAYDSSRLVRSEPTPGYAGASAPKERLSQETPIQSKAPSREIKLVIGDTSSLQVDRPPRIIDVGAFPPEPAAWTPVVLAVHASDDIGIQSVNLLWATPTTAITRLDMVDATKINTQRMTLEEGDLKEGYWSYEIPGQAAGTYMAAFVRVSDGERWAEDGPYIIFWSEAPPKTEAAPQPSAEPEVAKGEAAVGTKKEGMLFVESTTVVGRGDVSIKNEFREDSARYREELDGRGSIEMQSEKMINKGNPVVNITDSRLLVFDQGYLKGFKVMQSPGFHGGMGASVTERFNATTLEKSETGTISSLNRSQHALLFNSQQAFEGIWGTRTEYSNFNKKIKADQTLHGTFETQKRITFKD